MGRETLVKRADSAIGNATALILGRAGADVAVNHVPGQDLAGRVVREIAGFGILALAQAHAGDASQEDTTGG
ncbi:hypothetical protein AB0P15_28630 [Streptomyces sp. NPDC087917]|uniref:hypothetical protein n=1 Tax=Streptomyces sp. NPDC087917 TaxID=3155060 RepID=UPI00343AC780